MKVYKLPFGTIEICAPSIAEVTFDEGVVLDEDAVNICHHYLINSLIAPFSVLINKKCNYSFTFTAQQNIGNIAELKAMAVVIGTTGGALSAKTIMSINGALREKAKLFYKREIGLNWLLEQHQ